MVPICRYIVRRWLLQRMAVYVARSFSSDASECIRHFGCCGRRLYIQHYGGGFRKITSKFFHSSWKGRVKERGTVDDKASSLVQERLRIFIMTALFGCVEHEADVARSAAVRTLGTIVVFPFLSEVNIIRKYRVATLSFVVCMFTFIYYYFIFSGYSNYIRCGGSYRVRYEGWELVCENEGCVGLR